MSTAFMERSLKKYDSRIWGLVWKFHLTSGQPVEDLHAEAVYRFCMACARWNPNYVSKKGRATDFSAYAKRGMTNGLIHWSTKHDMPVSNEGFNERIDNAPTPRDVVMFRETLRNLSEEARYVAELILNTPDELVDLIAGEPPRTVKRVLRDWLTNAGWKSHAIQDAFTELRTVLAT